VAPKRNLDTDKYRDKLLEMKHELETDIKRTENTGDEREGINVTAADEDFDEQGGDAASETVERSRVLAIVGNLRDMLDEVNEALTKISDGTYGKCDVCGKQIPVKRLEALPHATMCTDCRARVLGG
jgi:RNA polymerase-binding protein DksA